MSCPFCDRIPQVARDDRNDLAAALEDAYPASPGHTLIVPLRHEPDFFSLSGEEQAAMWQLAELVRRRLQNELKPDGLNVGINVGAAAGQTVEHAHIHLIPRFTGDVPDPRGGVRWIIKDKARYW
jgi:diadenosine tetraphosphate (Ap4A) HIT family hydrolase